MKLYFPLIPYPVSKEEGGDVCDYVLQGFVNEADARELYPDAEIKVIGFNENIDPLLN